MESRNLALEVLNMPVELLVEVVVAAAHVHQRPAVAAVRQENLGRE